VTLLSSYCTAKRIENSADSDLGESHNLAQKVCPFIKANKANYSVLRSIVFHDLQLLLLVSYCNYYYYYYYYY